MNAEKKFAGTVDMTPTWVALLPVLIEVSMNGATAQGRTDAAKELARMAKLADSLGDALKHLRAMIGAHGNDEKWWETEGEHRYQNQIDNERLPYPTADAIREQVTVEAAAFLLQFKEG